MARDPIPSFELIFEITTLEGTASGTESCPITYTASPRWRSDAATSSPIKPEPITTHSLCLGDDRFAVGESSEPVNMRQVRAFDAKRARL